MTRCLSRLAVAAVLTSVVATAGCALSFRNPAIRELQQHPGRYQDKTVSVSGTVTTSWGVPLLPFHFYRVDDGTGQVVVLSEGYRTPANGEHVRVKGKVQDVAVLGGRALGLHIREEDVHVSR